VSSDPRDLDIEAVERLVARVLLYGGTVSVALMLVGLTGYAVHGGFHLGAADLQRVLRRQQEAEPPTVFVSLHEIARGVTHREPLAVIALGIALLAMTPVVGVAAAIPAFYRAGDSDYAVIAAIVLAVLVLSFFLAGGAG
jgi:uncharacterized membrane protein